MSKPVRQSALSLGDLQREVERSTAQLKRTRAAAERANQAYADAEEAYMQAQRGLVNGVTAVRAQTKMAL